jgi:hypothetical protein
VRADCGRGARASRLAVLNRLPYAVVSAVSTVQEVDAAAPDERVISGQPLDVVVATRPVQDVGCLVADERVCAARAPQVLDRAEIVCAEACCDPRGQVGADRPVESEPSDGVRTITTDIDVVSGIANLPLSLGDRVNFHPDHVIDALPPANWNPATGEYEE